MSAYLHPLQHWWENLNFTFSPAKVDGNDGIDTYFSIFYIIIIVLIMTNLEDLTVKNITLFKIKFFNHINIELPYYLVPTKVNGGGGIFTHCSTYYLIINVFIMLNLDDLTVKNIILSK